MLFCLYLRCRNKRLAYHQRVDHERKSTMPDLPFYLAKYKFPQDQLKFGPRIGVGAFGFTFKGRAQGIALNESETDVNIKMVKGMTSNGVRLYECDHEVSFDVGVLTVLVEIISFVNFCFIEIERARIGIKGDDAIGTPFKFGQFAWNCHR